jgi:hypothetical protein
MDTLGYTVLFMPDNIDGERGYRVYRNLHKRCWSVQAYVKGKGWRVWAHAERFRAHGCHFEVNAKGRERVRRTRSKVVHAYLMADFIELGASYFDDYGRYRVSYTPYDDLACFTKEGNVPVWRSKQVWADRDDIYVCERHLRL